MECFGFTLTLEDEIEDGRWRHRSEHHSGRIARVHATGRGYDMIFLVKEDEETGRLLPEVAVVWPMDGVLEEIRHKYPVFTEGWEVDERLCHELRLPVIPESGRPSECRITDPSEIAEFSPDFIGEMEKLDIALALYEESVEEQAAPAHKGNYCVALPSRDPLLVCAVFIGEKVIPWLRAAK